MLIELVGKFYDNHSLSIVNRNILKELRKFYQVRAIPTDSPNGNFKDIIREVEGIADIQIRHTYPPSWEWPEHSKTKVVYIQPWEYEFMPSEWQYKFDTFADAVIVPSTWNAKVYKKAGLNPSKVFTVANGYNPDVFKITNTKYRDSVLFVGNSQPRKGLDLVLQVWPQIKTSLKLVIKDSPQIYGQNSILDDILKLQYKTKCSKIEYIDSDLTEQEMANLYNNTKIILHPHRGEGFGMHIQEAMACGAIPLVTGNSATDDFVVNYRINSELIPADMAQMFAVKPSDSLSGMGNHRFINNPNIQDFANKANQLIHASKINSVDTSKLKTWEQVGIEYKEVLSKIHSFEKVRR